MSSGGHERALVLKGGQRGEVRCGGVNVKEDLVDTCQGGINSGQKQVLKRGIWGKEGPQLHRKEGNS